MSLTFTSCQKKNSEVKTQTTPNPEIYQPKPVNQRELPSRPANSELNPSQIEFWEYLTQFNQLPKKPSKLALALYNSKGIAPDFKFLKTSKLSVVGNLEGLTAHRDIFPERYPWVKELLEKYTLKIKVSNKRFSGSAKEIGEHYKNYMQHMSHYKLTKETPKQFVDIFLEGLLVVDYVYACGTEDDKEQAKYIWRGVFSINRRLHPFRQTIAKKLIIPATKEIGWASIDNFPESIGPQTAGYIHGGFHNTAPAEQFNFRKWLLKQKESPSLKNLPVYKLQWNLLQNAQLKAGLLRYSIYTAHCGDVVRPSKGARTTVVKLMFKRVFGKQAAKEYKNYLSLLNPAYPEN